MGLLEQAAVDLAEIISDVDGFAVPITLVDPGGNEATINGLATNIGLVINPETGMAASGQKASIALSIRAIEASGLVGLPCAVPDRTARPWTATLKLPAGEEQTFKVTDTMPDELGCLVCFLGRYEQ